MNEDQSAPPSPSGADAPQPHSETPSLLPSADSVPTDALSLETVRTNADRVLELIQTGGPVVAILVAMSVIALTIILAKLWQFRLAGVGARRRAREALRLWHDGDRDGALALAGRSRGVMAEAVARAMRGQRRGLPEAKVREEVVRYGGDALQALRAWFRPLEVIASLAPLLGLFGTVLGMIEAFRQLEQAGNQVNPAILSGGIWEALLTTAVGLAVAIPVVALLNWLERKVDRLAHDMDSMVTRIFTEDLSNDVVTDNGSEDHDGTGLRGPVAAVGA